MHTDASDFFPTHPTLGLSLFFWGMVCLATAHYSFIHELLVSRQTVLSNASRAEKRNRVGPSPNRGGLPGFSLGLGLDLTVCRPVYHGVYVAVAGGTLLGASRDGFAPNV